MAYRNRRGPCDACGQFVERAWRTSKPLLCVACGVEAAATAAMQMHQRAGPAYERHRAALARARAAGRRPGPRRAPKTDEGTPTCDEQGV